VRRRSARRKLGRTDGRKYKRREVAKHRQETGRILADGSRRRRMCYAREDCMRRNSEIDGVHRTSAQCDPASGVKYIAVTLTVADSAARRRQMRPLHADAKRLVRLRVTCCGGCGPRGSHPPRTAGSSISTARRCMVVHDLVSARTVADLGMSTNGQKIMLRNATLFIDHSPV
jgi:hypothetical protein